MVKEFEGKTEKEAIDNAIAALSLDREEFDVEIVESSRKGIFKKGTVKIRVYVSDDYTAEDGRFQSATKGKTKVIDFLKVLIKRWAIEEKLPLFGGSKVILK